ncbi:MAG: arginine deiminase-related protein [Kangiellaceae bacterium]|nr:arginine deiminase-related protein [Kangiellaceae bacterium]MCW8997538.1 arginine deiminase-related protein [Kangiellaceae bacterium]
MFTKAIVRTPSKSIVDGITSANLGKPVYEKALAQHADYVEALIECGLDVTILAAEEDYPDACFVEDVALMTPHCAIITNPGAESRKGETQSMIATVEDFYDRVEFIEAPGTVEAGDIMMVGEHYYIGLSDRTNGIGAMQMINYLEKHGMSGSTVNMSEMLHLKTGLSYLENNHLLATGEFVSKPEFEKYDMLEIPSEEEYAANSVWVNDTVLTPKGFPQAKAIIEKTGYKIREIDVSEFQKLDGGLSCLSLRF